MINRRTLIFTAFSIPLAGCARGEAATTPAAVKLIAAARQQVGVTLRYDPAYSSLAFPGGDVDRSKGVCTDVVIRAYRDALGLDLQARVNADMRAHFSAYPRRWGLSKPDRNIDHRRVPNLQSFFKRKGAQLAVPASLRDWQPGDIFTCMVGGNLPHIGIVTDKRSVITDRPLVLHNIGSGAREEDVLGDYPLTGRYRWGLS